MIPLPAQARPAGTSAPNRRSWPAASLTRRPGNRADRRKCSQHSRRPQITAPRARMEDPVKTLLTAYAARPFPGRPESARAARVWVASYLPGSPVADDVALMVSELVTNALRYSRSGQPGGRVTVILKISRGEVRVDVIDQGAVPELTEPVRHIDAALGEASRLGAGLVIVRELANTFGVEGPRRWFTLSLGTTNMPVRTSPPDGRERRGERGPS